MRLSEAEPRAVGYNGEKDGTIDSVSISWKPGGPISLFPGF